jgi:hypothetical protein
MGRPGRESPSQDKSSFLNFLIHLLTVKLAALYCFAGFISINPSGLDGSDRGGHALHGHFSGSHSLSKTSGTSQTDIAGIVLLK